MPLYEVALTKKPSKDEENEGLGEVLIWGPKPVSASTPEAAVAMAGAKAHAELADGDKAKLFSNLLSVSIRPFK